MCPEGKVELDKSKLGEPVKFEPNTGSSEPVCVKTVFPPKVNVAIFYPAISYSVIVAIDAEPEPGFADTK